MNTTPEGVTTPSLSPHVVAQFIHRFGSISRLRVNDESLSWAGIHAGAVLTVSQVAPLTEGEPALGVGMILDGAKWGTFLVGPVISDDDGTPVLLDASLRPQRSGVAIVGAVVAYKNQETAQN